MSPHVSPFRLSKSSPFQVLFCHTSLGVQQMDVFTGSLWIPITLLRYDRPHVGAILASSGIAIRATSPLSAGTISKSAGLYVSVGAGPAGGTLSISSREPGGLLSGFCLRYDFCNGQCMAVRILCAGTGGEHTGR